MPITPMLPSIDSPARRRTSVAMIAAAMVAGAASLAMSGCEAVGFMAESYKRGSTHEVKAEYRGLEGRSFAVVVTADRMIEADHPGITDRLSAKLTERLSAPTNEPTPAGFVPPTQVLRYLYDNPSWPARPLSELGKGLGNVERLVYVELNEYRLHDPGNPYEWDGVAAATISVLELDGATPDDFAFEKPITVKFPGKKGVDSSQLSSGAVTSALSLRLVDRLTWLFYDHQEPYYPEY
jgi:hypothetical protein